MVVQFHVNTGPRLGLSGGPRPPTVRPLYNKSQNCEWPQLWMPAAAEPMHFPRAGKNVLSYAYMMRTSLFHVACAAHQEVG